KNPNHRMLKKTSLKRNYFLSKTSFFINYCAAADAMHALVLQVPGPALPPGHRRSRLRWTSSGHVIAERRGLSASRPAAQMNLHRQFARDRPSRELPRTSGNVRLTYKPSPCFFLQVPCCSLPTVQSQIRDAAYG